MEINEKNAAQAEMFANRLKKRLAHLRKWAKRTGVEAFRLYDRDIPEIPLVLDLYKNIACGSLYKRPYEKDDAEEAVWLECMRNAAAEALETVPGNVIIKQRERQRGSDKTRPQYEKISDQKKIRRIQEGGFTFKVNLSDYLDTGLFLDRRLLRKMIFSDSDGKRVLNLFCYTASFSVYAAGGGAASTCSVDLSNTYLDWAQENFSLNNLKTEILRPQEYFSRSVKNENSLIRADVTSFLRQAAEAAMQWDSIILDPPAFSNSTMAENDLDLSRDYAALLSGCLALLSPHGKLRFSAAARSFKFNAEEIKAALTDRFTKISVTDISDKMIDEDFKGKKIPRTFLLEWIR